jgi:hypothetical protein
VRPNVETDFPPRDVQVGVMLLPFSNASNADREMTDTAKVAAVRHSQASASSAGEHLVLV